MRLQCNFQSSCQKQTPTLRVGYWNIEGLQNELTFQDFLDYISSFDIFAVSETWDESNSNLNLCPMTIYFYLQPEQINMDEQWVECRFLYEKR